MLSDCYVPQSLVDSKIFVLDVWREGVAADRAVIFGLLFKINFFCHLNRSSAISAITFTAATVTLVDIALCGKLLNTHVE
ncbi:hypothetical protein Plhal710r2_c011g0049971 [Plasmopara halstedii]